MSDAPSIRAARCPADTPAGSPAPAVAWGGIGDEAGSALEDQVAAMDRLGWQQIELRRVGGTAIADLSEAEFSRLRDTLERHGLGVPCVASRIGDWSRAITGDFETDLRELAALAPRCTALGATRLRVMTYLNDGLDDAEWGRRVRTRMRELTRRAEDAGLLLVVENCTGWAGASAERMLALLDAVDSPALRLLFDTGNGVAYGYEAPAMLADILHHVVHVHVKDACGDRDRPLYTLPGDGAARVADCLRLLLEHGYRGVWSLEPHLSLRPHLDEAEPDRMDAFTAAGRALERLVAERVLPGASAWRRVPGGLRRDAA